MASLHARTTGLAVARRHFARFCAVPTYAMTMGGGAVLTCVREKGDYGFNVFHNSNPQHGGSYARHERRMRDDEVEDFMRSVKGWTPVRETVADAPAENPFSSSLQSLASTTPTTTAASAAAAETATSSSTAGEEAPPEASPLQMGEEAIMRTFHFENFGAAYLFMGRFWAFCYGSDKYPNVVWNGTEITVYLYSPSFRGLSKREARLAAFLNDQYNMLKKSQTQQQLIVETIAKRAVVEACVGEAVNKDLAARELRRHAPLPEAKIGATHWTELLRPPTA